MSDTPHEPTLDLVVLDCPDALELGRFYAEVLGWQLEDGSEPAAFASTSTPSGTRSASSARREPRPSEASLAPASNAI